MQPYTKLFLLPTLLCFISCGVRPAFDSLKNKKVTPSFSFDSLSSSTMPMLPYFSSPSFGPFNIYDDNVILSGTFTDCYVLAYLKVRLKKINASSYVSSTQILPTQDTTSGSGEFSISLPFNKYFDVTGLTIDISLIQRSNYHTLTNFYFHIYPKNSIGISSKDYKSKDYILSNRVMKLNGQEGISVDETFSFKETRDYFSTDQYYRLNLDDIYFTYQCDESFAYTESFLTTEDVNNVFSGLKNENGDIEVPLSISYIDNKVSFAFKDIMYVSTSTLEMSLTPKEGFVQTKYFYLPRNKRNDLDGYEFEIYTKNIGYNDTDVSIPLVFYSGQNIVGDCLNGEYCVIGGIRK